MKVIVVVSLPEFPAAVIRNFSIMRSATESVIKAEELERLQDDMDIGAEDATQIKPDFPALSAVDAMVS